MRTSRTGAAAVVDVRRRFDDAAHQLGSVLDAEQRPAADRLAVLGAHVLGAHVLAARSTTARPWTGLRRSRGPMGVYLHGPVGRGKTWLVDVLVERLPPGSAQRLHAYEAARQLHRTIAAHAGGRGGLDAAITDVVVGARVLFLDELHAHDPGDAMLLSRLVRALPERGVRLLATSNYAPAALLPDPRHHHLVLRASAKSSCQSVGEQW